MGIFVWKKLDYSLYIWLSRHSFIGGFRVVFASNSNSAILLEIRLGDKTYVKAH